jgi:hypothetical protein
MSARLESLAGCTRRELARRFEAGRPVGIADLVGRRFLGRSLGQPGVVERLTWRTFRKDVRAADDGVNVRLPQPWQMPDRPEREEMPFVLTATDDGAVIDYRPRHPLPHPLGLAVDPLRRIDDGAEGDPMVLLGVTELWLGRRRLRTPTWFALTPLEDVVEAP